MKGYTEDLMNLVVKEIVDNWDRLDGNLSYFVNRVRKSGLTTADLENYLVERGKVGPTCVTTVFNVIIHEESTESEEKGGESWTI